jgi:flavin reductase (DIM6/NTAB) family NADH-FMN oxidoreductase RutF
MVDPSSIEGIGQALAKIPSGCCILTCAAADDETGMLASWVQQASFDPPMITLALNKARYANTLVERARRFTLNIVGENPTPMFRHFGSGFGPGEPAFDGLKVARTDHGAELSDAIAHLACEVTAVQSAGDHQIYLARVVRGGVTGDARPYVHIRKSGLSY